MGEISAEEIVFAYPARPLVNVANGLNLRASRGEKIALIGSSGGGKSTIISLLQRFYAPKSGEIVCFQLIIKGPLSNSFFSQILVNF